MNDISVSSINNVSKHSFEEVEKHEPASSYQPPLTQPQSDLYFQSEPPSSIVVGTKEAFDDYDNFEEITESREIVEERIGALKLQLVDFTVKQQELSEKTRAL